MAKTQLIRPSAPKERNVTLMEELNYQIEKAKEFIDGLISVQQDIKIIIDEISNNSNTQAKWRNSMKNEDN